MGLGAGCLLPTEPHPPMMCDLVTYWTTLDTIHPTAWRLVTDSVTKERLPCTVVDSIKRAGGG